MLDPVIFDKLQIIRDYLHMHQTPKKSDVIIVFWQHDERMCEYACDLFLEWYAPYILFSWYKWNLHKWWETTEAEKFREIAIEKWIPEDKIFIEKESRNTEQNLKFSIKILEENGIDPQTIIFVQTFAERRLYSILQKWIPNKIFTVSSPDMSLMEYLSIQDEIEEDIHLMVWQIQRIKEYPKRWFQIKQDIPDDVWFAYEYLVSAGYDQWLIKD